MSTDFNLMCEYKETKDFKWEAYKNPNGTVWDSKFWGISCIKRAFMSKNGHNNNQEKFSKGVEDLYGHYRQLSIVDNLSFDFEYLNSDEMIILSEFVLDMAKIMKEVEGYFDYRWVISPDC